jgi:hypothetical protein
LLGDCRPPSSLSRSRHEKGRCSGGGNSVLQRYLARNGQVSTRDGETQRGFTITLSLAHLIVTPSYKCLTPHALRHGLYIPDNGFDVVRKGQDGDRTSRMSSDGLV